MGVAWITLSAIAGILLLLNFTGGKNSTWGAATLGAIGGLVATIVVRFTSGAFHWVIVWKWIVVAVLVNAALELLDGAVRKGRVR